MKKIILLFLLIFTLGNLRAQNIIFEEIENDFEVSVSTPKVKSKIKDSLKSLMKENAMKFYRLGMEVELARGEEVVIVTIPSDELFEPNETTLRKEASKILDNFKSFISPKGKYKLLLVMHSDDTGSEDYLFSLTDSRVISVMEYFDKFSPADDTIKGYPKGETEPLVENDSRANRALNRRLEIFIVPDGGLLEELSRK